MWGGVFLGADDWQPPFLLGWAVDPLGLETGLWDCPLPLLTWASGEAAGGNQLQRQLSVALLSVPERLIVAGCFPRKVCV